MKSLCRWCNICLPENRKGDVTPTRWVCVTYSTLPPVLTWELRRLPLFTTLEPPPAVAPCLTNSRLVLHPSSATNEPASTQSKSSDDTDGGGNEEGGCWRLIFTLDSPSSPLDCRVYLPTQLASAKDRQTDRRWASVRGDGEGGSGGALGADCLWRWASSLSGCLEGAPPPPGLCHPRGH